MADQKTTDAGVAFLLKTFYDKKLIERLEPQLHLYQLAQKRPIPSGAGKTIEFTKYNNMLPMTADSNELSSTQVYVSGQTISATLTTRHQYVQFSSMLKMTAIDQNLLEAINVLADSGARSVEFKIREKLIGIGFANRSSVANASINTSHSNINYQGIITGTSAQQHHRIYSDFALLNDKARLGASASITDTVAGSAMTVRTVGNAVTYLENQDAKPMDGVNFVMLANPTTVDQLMVDPAFKTWNQFGNADKMFNNEVGMIRGVRILKSTFGWRYVYSAAPWSTASGALNASLVVGKDAFAVTEINGGKGTKGIELIVKNSGSGNTADPANLIHTAATKLVMAEAILNKSSAAWILTSDRAVSSGS